MKNNMGFLNIVDTEKQKLLELFDKNVIASNTDLKGIITYASQAFCDISGYTKNELIGKNHSILRHPDMPKDLYKDLWTTILEKKEWKGEVKNLKKDGGYYWVRVTITPIYDNRNNHTGYSAIREDITSQKNVEKLSFDLNQKIKLVELKNYENQLLLESFDKNIISSKTDLRGVVTYVSEAFCKISGFEKEELLGMTHNVVRHADMPKELFTDLWNTLLQKKVWHGEIKNRTKNGGYYWVEAIISPLYSSNNQHIGYSAIRYDITAQKELESLSKEFEKNKQFLDDVLDSQEQIVVTTDGESLISMNKRFLDVFGFEDKMEFLFDYECICDLFHEEDGFIKKDMNGQSWINYILSNPSKIHKVKFIIDNQPKIYSVSVGNLTNENNTSIKSAVFTDITELENVKNKVEFINKQMKESIEYASLIQQSIIPNKVELDKFFSDHFVMWEPKDIVGGDIYLFEKLNDNEALVLVVDCTGHGVAGAFLTMLVKAVKKQLLSEVYNDLGDISTSDLLKKFSVAMQQLLIQNNQGDNVHLGFDGMVLYINKRRREVKFSSSEVPLFYKDKNQNVQIVKADRNSFSIRNANENYTFKENVISLEGNMRFYITTDGYIDQNGGEKSFSFGKSNFKKIIEKSINIKPSEQKEVFENQLAIYQGHEERNDDITVVCFELNEEDTEMNLEHHYSI